MSGKINPAAQENRHRFRAWRWVGVAAGLIALLLVFSAYRQPDMMMQMAQQLWSCF